MQIKLNKKQFQCLHEILTSDDRASFRTPNMSADTLDIEPGYLHINGSTIERDMTPNGPEIIITLPDD